MKKVLITCNMHPFLVDGFSDMKFECEHQPNINYDRVVEIISSFDGIVVGSNIKVDKQMIDKASGLKFIARAGSGMENINEKYAKSKGIFCINSPEGNRDAVGEHIIGLLLSLLNNINKSDKQIRQKIWEREPNRGIELQDKVMGIIGYGNTGQALAEKLKGFDVSILAYDKYRTDYSTDTVKESTLDEIFDKADILSINVPLTDETKNMIDLKFIEQFRKNIYLINSARGKILNTNDLIKCLKKGKLIGAALDVYENENLDNLQEDDKKWFNFLIRSDKVILTPHIAGWTNESKEKIVKVLVSKIKKLYLCS